MLARPRPSVPEGDVNRVMKQADLTSEMPAGTTETSRLTSRFVGAGVDPSCCSRPGRKNAKSKAIVYISRHMLT